MPYPTTPTPLLSPVISGSVENLVGATGVVPVRHDEAVTGGIGVYAISTANTWVPYTGAGKLCRIYCLGGTLGEVRVVDGSGPPYMPCGPRSGGGYWPVPGTYEEFQMIFSTNLTVWTLANTLLVVTYEPFV